MTGSDQGEVLTSPRNERVKAVAALRRRKGRRQQGRFLVEGPHPVQEAMADGWVEEVFCLPDLASSYRSDVPLTLVDERVLEHMADTTTPQGVLAVARPRTAELADVVGRGTLVVLEQAADPGNVGTLIRTADAAGAAGVVLTRGSADPFGPKVVRAAAGSISHVPLVVDVDARAVLEACRAAGQRTIGLAADGDLDLQQDGTLVAPVALVVGSEAHGLSAAVRGLVDAMGSLRVYGHAESLNLAVAAAIALYEAARQQRSRST